MFPFTRKTPRQPSSILIDGLACVTSDQLKVDTVWQQRHTISAMGDILSKAINDPTDPLDTALLQYIDTHALSMPQQRPFHSVAFDPHDGVSGNIWHHGEYYLPAIKGMPERILEHCDMSDNERESIMIQLHAMSATGNTVIAVATGLLRRSVKDLRHLKNNEKLSFIGFISLQTSIAGEAKRLISNTNVHIRLATGQHPAAAFTIASQLGLATRLDEVFDARRLDVMNTREVRAIVTSVKVFARATPERKQHILEAIKATDNSAAQTSTLADLQKLLAN